MADETLDPASAELETQLRRLETITDPASRSIATDLLASVLQFHSAALERMLTIIDGTDGGGAVLDAFDEDPIVRGVLLVHDLHPDSLQTRVRRAVAELEPLLTKRGAELEVIAAEGGLVRVRIKREDGPTGALAEAVEQALRAAAPEAIQVIVEEPAMAGASFVPLQSLTNNLTTCPQPPK